MLTPHVPVEIDLDGWSATLPGGVLNPVLLFIGTVHFALGSVFAVGGFVSILAALMEGQLFLAAVALLFMLVGSVFATWPPRTAYRALHRAHIEVSGRSLRLRRSLLGITLAQAELDLAECRDPWLPGSKLELGGHRFPIAGGEDVENVVRWIEQGAADAAANPDQVPPMPEALRKMRAGSAA